MWKQNTVFGMVAIMVVALAIIACDNGNKNTGPKCECTVKEHPNGSPCTCPVAGTSACDCTEEALSFENFSTASVLVKNNIGKNFVAFKDTISPATLISGIPAYAENHGLKKDTVLFSSAGDFVLVLITRDQYNANKNNLALLNGQEFAKLYAVYNSTSSPFTITIGSRLGGNGRLIITNPSSYNVVIHLDYPTGETIGYVPANSINTAIPLVAPGSYEIYPVFTIFDSSTLELFTIIATTEEETNVAGKPFKWSVSLDSANPSMSVDVSTILDQVNVMTSGGAYLKIINNSTTAVGLFINAEPRTTSTGISLVNSSANVVFPLLFTRNPDGSIKLSQSFPLPESSVLQIGTETNLLPVTTQQYDLDYLYEIEVTGSDASNLQLDTVTKKDKIDLIQQ